MVDTKFILDDVVSVHLDDLYEVLPDLKKLKPEIIERDRIVFSNLNGCKEPCSCSTISVTNKGYYFSLVFGTYSGERQIFIDCERVFTDPEDEEIIILSNLPRCTTTDEAVVYMELDDTLEVRLYKTDVMNCLRMKPLTYGNQQEEPKQDNDKWKTALTALNVGIELGITDDGETIHKFNMDGLDVLCENPEVTAAILNAIYTIKDVNNRLLAEAEEERKNNESKQGDEE